MRARNTSLWSIALLSLTLLLSVEVGAQGKPADAKVDISDLENKYWAPKDTDFSVVQNRTYTKDGRFFITPQWGRPVNDQWSEGNLFGLTANYFWSERMGVQLSYISAGLNDKDAVATLRGFGTGVAPDFGRLKSHYSVGYNLVPFYAKMSVWGKKIIYFDMAITPTVGMTQYTRQISTGDKDASAFTYGFDITQMFLFSNWVALRVDLKNNWRREDILKYKSSSGQFLTGDKVKTITTQDTMFLMGLMFFF